MGNKVVAMACTFLKKHPSITTIEDFRSEFADLPRTLPAKCVIDEIENIARREFARRIESAKAPEYIDGPDGEKVEVRRKPRDARPTPLTHFLLSGANYGDGRPRYFHRRATKGWRWMVADDDEVRAWRKQGVPMLKELPQEVIRKRRVA